MADELDPAERAWLQDMDAFNERIASRGWHLRDKIVRENLSHIRLHNSTMDSVDIRFVEFNGASINDSQFTAVYFFQTKFEGARITGAVFTNCRFDSTSFSGAVFQDCHFVDCEAERLTARNVTFLRCTFEAFSDDSGVVGPGVFEESRFTRSALHNTGFHGMTFHSVVFEGSSLDLVIYEELKGDRLRFEASTLSQCAFGQFDFETLAFERCTIRGISLQDVHCKELNIQACESIEALSIARSTFENLVTADCPMFSEWTLRESRLMNFAVQRSHVAYWEITSSQISGDSRIAECQIAGLNLTGSALTETQFTGCDIHLYLVLNETALNGVRLNGITYGDVRFSDAGVSYLNDSDRFLAP